MSRRNLFGLILATLVGLSSGGGLTKAEPREPLTPMPLATTPIQATPGIAVAGNASCVSQCQAQHDLCRVATKGSRSCDAERQRCLEICLQKKKK